MIIKAKYALLAPGEVRRDVRIEVSGEWLSVVSSGFSPYAQEPDIDFGDAVVTPGFVNPHCHLELEFCQNKTPFTGSFIDWLQAVRDLKAEHPGGVTTYPEASLNALAASGCTTVCDHHTAEMEYDRIDEFGIRYLPFAEFFGFRDDPDIRHMKSAAHWGYAPHAPYTAGLEVARICRSLSDKAGRPMSLHLSEFLGEITFIREGSDREIEELLRRANSLPEAPKATGKSAIAYCAERGLLTGPTYAIHCNYLAEGDLDIMAKVKPTVVYCPRSHDFFGHKPHPMDKYLERGIPVALGTDSLASNDKLSPLAEAAVAREKFPNVPPAQLFKSITTEALAPLGWQDKLGQLMPGRQADFAVYPLASDPGEDFDGLFDAILATGESVYTVCGGKVIHSAVPVTAQ